MNKKLLTIAVLVITVSVGYFFLSYLPQKERGRVGLQHQEQSMKLFQEQVKLERSQQASPPKECEGCQ